MGSYGAVAEFFHEPGEAIATDARLSCITPRGGIRLEPREDIEVCEYEKSSGGDPGKQKHIALCLPLHDSRMSGAAVLSERGRDESALKDEDRDDVLFDLGVSAIGRGCFQLDFCARTGDPDLIDLCRQYCGSSVFDHGSPVIPALLERQPHRVIITRLGRIEVYQAIGGETTAGKSPIGPHTHLLPELLRSDRTHAADTPIADGWVPCAFLYPQSTMGNYHD